MMAAIWVELGNWADADLSSRTGHPNAHVTRAQDEGRGRDAFEEHVCSG